MNRKQLAIGQKFGKLEIISCNPGVILESGRRRISWLCRCECGTERYFAANHLTRAERPTRSCGCLRIENGRKSKGGKVGVSPKYEATINSSEGRHRAYRSWVHMLRRCYDEKHHKYQDYGGRGIKVCDQWRHDFDQFFRDTGERPKGLTLGRKDNDGDYEPSNCRWETAAQQNNNKRNTIIVTQDPSIGPEPLAVMCRRLELPFTLIASRLKLGWSLKQALADLIA